MDFATRDHQEWIGYLQPVGLVVSAAALADSGVILPRVTSLELNELRNFVENGGTGDKRTAAIPGLPVFFQALLGWDSDLLVSREQDADSFDALTVYLPEYETTLEPTFLVRDVRAEQGASPWLLLIKAIDHAQPFDRKIENGSRDWSASAHDRFERLLRETNIPIGLLFNETHFRLIYAPKGETSGFMDFPVNTMIQSSGRTVYAAFKLLLGRDRIAGVFDKKERLPGLLETSRKIQATVSDRLAEQVLAALYELLRGFQSANDQKGGALLNEVLREDPSHIYRGLLTVLLRLVFVLYAEDRGLLSTDDVFQNHYSVGGLFERLRNDRNHHPDTMDQRYGAWAQLLALFRLVYDGGGHGDFHLPARHGYLFNPDRYNFLEGRPWKIGRSQGELEEPPMVCDGVIFRVLENLMVLDGERLSYRTLDVEQIGSVYEKMMGFELEVTKGPSIAIKPAKSQGAPATINLEELLATERKHRTRWLKEKTDQKITGEAERKLQEAGSVEDLLKALEKKIDRRVTPNTVPPESMVLQPSDERRRSGSHYTPRSLTEPIARQTLEPILKQLSDKPTPEQILDLKVCDPAMGSGAFLVEACRQLGDELIKAWHNHSQVPAIPPDEDEIIYARRQVAQRCLYGVDKNEMAVDLAKLSLWLATLARDHAFTFLDHSLKHGDSLVGLNLAQIAAFHWNEDQPATFLQKLLEEKIQTAIQLRSKIQKAGESKTENELRADLKEVNDALFQLKAVADLAIAAFFQEEKPADRERTRKVLLVNVEAWIRDGSGWSGLNGQIERLSSGRSPLIPFHWELEFPEVFLRSNPGFDGVIGNPPFAGKNNIVNSNREGYLDWLKSVHPQTHGNSDLVAHFFRRSFRFLRANAAFGLIATNTISQGDTRSTGLRWICENGGSIYAATRRYKWPGAAAVVVSVVNVLKGDFRDQRSLDGRAVNVISAFLFHSGQNSDPVRLASNDKISFQGSIVLGMGFTFDDSAQDGSATPIAEMERLIAKEESYREKIFPFIGGEEVNNDPCHLHHRYIINFSDASEDEAIRSAELYQIVKEKVFPVRRDQKRDALRERWWQYAEKRPGLYSAISGLNRVLVVNCGATPHLAFAFLNSKMVFAHSLIVFPKESYAFFALLQSRVHEIWARFFGSSMKDDLRYTPTDCFETFPFPPRLENNQALEDVGRSYYEFRAQLMVENNEGLTKTYNRFHDPDENDSQIIRLRELHAEMDRAVLDAYEWRDVKPTCEYILDYEDDEEDGSSRRKKPYRYRWPDEIRDEVLARLLDLNQQRANEEKEDGLAKAAEPRAAYKAKKKKRHGDDRYTGSLV